MRHWIGFTAVAAVAAFVFCAPMIAPAPARAGDVNIGVTIGPPPPPPIVVATPPQLVVVPGTPVYYAPAIEFNFFAYGGRYYTFYNGAWFVARAHNAPWAFIAVDRVPQPVLGVPVTYYRVPPGHARGKGGPPPWAGHGKGRKRD